MLTASVGLLVACGSDGRHARTETSPATSSPPAASRTAQATPGLPILRDLRHPHDNGFPNDTRIIFATGGFGHGPGGYFRVERAYRHGLGAVRRDVLFEPPAGLGVTNITGVEADESGKLFLTLCVGEQCPLEGGPKRVRTQLLASTDGGISWKKESELDGEWWVRQAIGGGAVVVSFDQTFSWKLLPANKDLTPPPLANNLKPLRFNGALAWSSNGSPEVIDQATGLAVYAPEVGNPASTRIDAILAVDGNFAVTWTDGATRESGIGLFTPAGAPFVQPMRAPAGLDPRVAVDPYHIIATVEYERPGACTVGGLTAGADPAVVNLGDALYGFISEPFYDASCSHGTQRVITAQRGFTARVKTNDDCVAIYPSVGGGSSTLGCVRDGVLVMLRPPVAIEGQPPDSPWQTVQLPDGRIGVVRKEFLER